MGACLPDTIVMRRVMRITVVFGDACPAFGGRLPPLFGQPYTCCRYLTSLREAFGV